MATTKNLLLVTNSLSEQHLTQLQQAVPESITEKTNLHLVYVLPPIPACYFQVPGIQDYTDELKSEALEQLQAIGKQLHIPINFQWLLQGDVKAAARKLAQRIRAESVVLEDCYRSVVSENILEKIEKYFHHKSTHVIAYNNFLH